MKVCTIAEFSNGKSVVAYWSECKEENPEIYLYDVVSDTENFLCEISIKDFNKIKNQSDNTSIFFLQKSTSLNGLKQNSQEKQN